MPRDEVDFEPPDFLDGLALFRVEPDFLARVPDFFARVVVDFFARVEPDFLARLEPDFAAPDFARVVDFFARVVDFFARVVDFFARVVDFFARVELAFFARVEPDFFARVEVLFFRVDPDFAAPDLERDELDLDLPDEVFVPADFLDPLELLEPLERELFASPACARCLFTVRAASSSALSSERPLSSYESLMCSYWRSRLGLDPCGISIPP